MDSKTFGVSACKACGAPIRWMITEKLKRMPCNLDGVFFNPGGGNETFVSKTGKVIRGKRAVNGESFGYISHFATCPFSDRFRKGGRHEKTKSGAGVSADA